mmetsp:Transcript_2183/g.5192  ORF Transcript_2183/g.5192 Transcript_2183/m.5192 type:complete len:87 (+) Transcript_2183:240-500(+)
MSTWLASVAFFATARLEKILALVAASQFEDCMVFYFEILLAASRPRPYRVRTGGPRGRAIGRGDRKARINATIRRTWVEDSIPAHF